MAKKRVLVTGAAGFIGSHTTDLLIKKGYDVFCLDNFSSGKLENIEHHKKKLTVFADDEKQQIIAMDVVNPQNVYDVLKKWRPASIIHLAAQPSLMQSVRNPDNDLLTNAFGTVQLAVAAKKFGVKRFVFASTSAVYPTEEEGPFREDDADIHGIGSPYGMSKFTAERYIQLLFPNHAILRYANVYGPRQVPLGMNQVVPKAIRHALFGDEFHIYLSVNGAGVQTRDYVYVKDVAKANLAALEKGRVGIFNVCTGISSSVNDVCGAIAKALDQEIPWKTTIAVTDNRNVAMDGSKFEKAFRKKMSTNLESGITSTVEWWKKNG